MKNAHRIGVWQYYDDAAFEKLKRQILENIQYYDEISLFTEYSHFGYWPLEYVRDIADVVRKRIGQLKAIGIKTVGINPLCTVGHFEEALDFMPEVPMQTMVNSDGEASKSCPCVSGDDFRKYIAERYKILAGAKPDFIWVDDDFRPTGHGVCSGFCYCPECIRKYNERYAAAETFESIAAAKPGSKLYKNYAASTYENYAEVARIIEEAVREVSPDTLMGQMTIGGADFNWFKDLKAVKGRPGNGFYRDDVPFRLLRKVLDVEYQLHDYPEFVTDRQYEFENFPYQQQEKSSRFIALECLYATLLGCSGVAFDNQGFPNRRMIKALDDNIETFDEIIAKKPVKGLGIYCGRRGDVWMRLGLPVTSIKDGACAYIIDRQALAAHTPEEIKKMLAKGSLVLGEALKDLEKAGLLPLCGVRIEKGYANGIEEKFTDHPLNGENAGYVRNAFMNFYDKRPEIIYTLIPEEGAGTLSMAQSINRQTLGPCMTAYENSLGGRVCVMTYSYPDFCRFDEKRDQIRAVFDYITRGEVPVTLHTHDNVIPMVRQCESGEMLAALINMSNDESEPFVMSVTGHDDEIVEQIKPWSYIIRAYR